MQAAICKDVITNFNFIQKCIDIYSVSVYVDGITQKHPKAGAFYAESLYLPLPALSHHVYLEMQM